MESVALIQAKQSLGDNVSLQEVLHGAGEPHQKAEAVSKEFESLFLHKILMQMDATVNREEGLVYGGMAEDMYRGMMYQELARKMSHTGGIGIADMVMSEFEEKADRR